jgi:hypothetical protein
VSRIQGGAVLRPAFCRPRKPFFWGRFFGLAQIQRRCGAVLELVILGRNMLFF